MFDQPPYDKSIGTGLIFISFLEMLTHMAVMRAVGSLALLGAVVQLLIRPQCCKDLQL